MHYSIIICIFIGYISVLTTVASQKEGNCRACGRYNPLKIVPIIIGGTRVEPFNKYPWVISIKEPGQSTHCGGAIIDEYWILTAAHCVDAYNQWHVAFLDESVGRIATIFVHPQYNRELVMNDIALLRLESPIQCGPSKSPICLPAPNAPPPMLGTKMGINGWGATLEGAGNSHTSASSFLKETELTFVDPKVCPVDGRMFHCVTGAGAGGICYGDSGGIGYNMIGNYYFATGVASFTTSTDCYATFPGAYTKVTAYMDWITKVSGVGPSAFA